MSNVEQAQAITIKSSAELVSEFFYYGINTILYQRGVYPPEAFTREEKYGIPLLVTTEDSIKKYLSEVMDKIKDWILQKKVDRLVLLLQNVETTEVIERWDFRIEYEDNEPGVQKDGAENKSKSPPKGRELKKIQREIQDVLRQVIASIAILPLLETACGFDILTYITRDADVPNGWGDTNPGYITNGEEVQLKSFSTGFHQVKSLVSYKVD